MIRALFRTLPPRVQFELRVQAGQLRSLGPRGFWRWHALLLDAAIHARRSRSSYRYVDEQALRDARRSDTVFVFGSGYSLHDITPAQWAHIAAHDTFGFNEFVRQHWVRVDYHLIRGGVERQVDWRRYTEDFCSIVNASPFYADTMFLMQGEYQAHFANNVLGHRLLRPGARVYRFRTARGSDSALPTRTLRDGVRHIYGTLSDVVNAAACLGWRRIVLTGVDLYDTRYFWLRPNETYDFDPRSGLIVSVERNHHGVRYDEVHNTARNGIVELLGAWRRDLEERGIELNVFNPRSLLAEVMPVYRIDALRQSTS